MKKLEVKRFIQDPAHCAVAAVAAIANFHNSDYDYAKVKKIAKLLFKDLDDGLNTGEIGILLNSLGLKKVKIVSSDIRYLDYKWAKYSKKKLIKTLKRYAEDCSNDYYLCADDLANFLENETDNQLILDYDYKRFIISAIDQNNPPLLSFNWTMLFKFSKYEPGTKDFADGEVEEHAVAINGYDKEHAHIVDSHVEYYTYSRKKYRKGYYKILWHHLLTAMHWGDVVIAEEN
jgi:hypothetical protein